jgi:hypothetical protein
MPLNASVVGHLAAAFWDHPHTQLWLRLACPLLANAHTQHLNCSLRGSCALATAIQSQLAQSASCPGTLAREQNAIESSWQAASTTQQPALQHHLVTVAAASTPHGVQVAGDTTEAYWQCLGMYAMPGRVVTITVPQAVVAAGEAMLHIGGWTDLLYERDKWARLPEVVRKFMVTSRVTSIASAHGGLIYLILPGGLKLGRINVQVAGKLCSAHGMPAMNVRLPSALLGLTRALVRAMASVRSCS